MSTDVIVDQLLTFLFAGYDTSAITLGYDLEFCNSLPMTLTACPCMSALISSYAMYLLAKHPDVLSKVQMEASLLVPTRAFVVSNADDSL